MSPETNEITPTTSGRELVRQTLLALAEDNGGRLDQRTVVDAAREPTHILHDRFTWDDSVAGERYRLMQAGVLIRQARVTIIRVDDTTREIAVDSVRALESPGSERSKRGAPRKGGSYVPSRDIASDPELRAALIATVLKELTAIQNRYRAIHELDKVWKAIDKVTEAK